MGQSWRDLASTYVLRHLASPCLIMSLISGDKGRVRDDFIIKDKKSDKDNEEKDPSHRARRGLKRLMLREDYVEDKSIFELKKHTGVCPTL